MCLFNFFKPWIGGNAFFSLLLLVTSDTKFVLNWVTGVKQKMMVTGKFFCAGHEHHTDQECCLTVFLGELYLSVILQWWFLLNSYPTWKILKMQWLLQMLMFTQWDEFQLISYFLCKKQFFLYICCAEFHKMSQAVAREWFQQNVHNNLICKL